MQGEACYALGDGGVSGARADPAFPARPWARGAGRSGSAMTTGGGAPGPDAPREKAAAPPARRTVASDDLFQGLWELVILHRNDEYLLRITRAGKLILTK